MGTQYDIIYGLTGDSNIVEQTDVESIPFVVYLQDKIDKLCTITRTASGDISKDDPLLLLDTGYVTLPRREADEEWNTGVFTGIYFTQAPYHSLTYHAPTDRFLMVSPRNGLSVSSWTAAITGNGAPVLGQRNSIATANIPNNCCLTTEIGQDKFALTYSHDVSGANNEFTYVRLGTILLDGGGDPSQDQLSYGAEVLLPRVDNSGDVSSAWSRMTWDSNYKVAAVWSLHANWVAVHAVTFDTGTPVYGTTTFITSASSGFMYNDSVYDTVNQRHIVQFAGADDNLYHVIGTTNTSGPSAVIDNINIQSFASGQYPNSITVDTKHNRVICVHNGDIFIRMRVGILDPITNVITWGDDNYYSGDIYGSYPQVEYIPEIDKIIYTVNKGNNHYILIGTLDPTDDLIDWEPYTLYYSTAASRGTKIAYSPVEDKLLLYAMASTGAIAFTYKIGLDIFSHGKLIGIATADCLSGSDCVVGRYGYVASVFGPIESGYDLYVNEIGELVPYDTGHFFGTAVSSTSLIVKA